MLIRSVRLKNIKSFGEGADGTGVRVTFDRGLNRLAGANGSGKSTLIESIGYALFDHAPETGYRLDRDTLLLRHGAKEGEIEVEIETADGPLFVRRGVGKQAKLRWTVRDASGFVIQETEPEVRRILAQAARLAAPEGLSELFRKLVGVRQGRLLDPFELSPSDARRHFAPILDVEIYQRCFDELKTPEQSLKDQEHATELKISQARARSEMLAGAPQEAEAFERRLADAQPELESRREQLARAQQERDAWDARQNAIPASSAALEAARKDVENSEKTLAARRELLVRAQSAQAVLDAHAQSHERYLKAQDEIASVAGKHSEFMGLRERASSVKQQRAAAGARANETGRRARELTEAVEKRAMDLAGRLAVLQERRKSCEGGEDGASPAGPDFRPADEALNNVQRWSAALTVAGAGARSAGKAAAEADRLLAHFDPQLSIRSNQALETTRQTLEAKRLAFTEMDARRRSRRDMAKGLEESQQCPLLTERCKQFDKGKLVLSEVRLDGIIETAKNEIASAEVAFKQAETQAAVARKAIDDTSQIRANASSALDELRRCLDQAADGAARAALERLSRDLGTPELQPQGLPAVPVFPNPGLDPWAALAAAGTVAAGFCAFVEGVARLAERGRSLLEERKLAGNERRRKLEQEQQVLDAEAKLLAELGSELANSRQELAKLNDEARAAQVEFETLSQPIAEMDLRQAEMEVLEARKAKAEAEVTAHAEGHRSYVAAETDAARLEQTRADVALALGDLERGRSAAAAAFEAREAARANYDSGAHAQAKAALLAAAQRVSALETELARDREGLAQARQRVRMLEDARKEWASQESRHALLTARRELLHHARGILRDAGPRVAEHLVNAVNTRAQRIYMALSPHDPGQLDWQPDYELRVATTSGVRRFAMLSGGQKVKAALSLQLALVQQFTQAGICVFDEPTYALDMPSRGLLAEAVAEAQRISHFDQLFIVSHDDAFDGHVEHTVSLVYSPVTGTQVE